MPTEKARATALALIQQGVLPETVQERVGASKQMVKKWMLEKDFLEARERYLQTLKDEVMFYLVPRLAQMTSDAVDSVHDGIKNDPKLALDFLKQTGGLARMGELAGFDPGKVGPDNSFSITINTTPPEDRARVIEAEPHVDRDDE